MTRLLVTVAIVVATTAAPGIAVAQDDVPEACRTIIGCPDAGPEPEHSGDRGGWAQLLTLGVLVIAVSFILTKVLRAARRTAATPRPDQPGS